MTEMSGRPYMSSMGISDPLSLDNGHSVASVLFDVQSPPLLHSLFSQGSTSPAVMNPSGDSLFFHSAGQPSVLYSATSSSSKDHAPKRHRDCEEQMIGMNGLKPVSSPALLFNTEQERRVMSSCVSSQINEANNQHYLTAGESDCSSDEDPLGYPGIESDPTCGKMKRIKLDGISAASGNPETESTRRNQSPACRYDVVRVALLRFRELFGNTCVKRGFVVPSGSADWPEETWGIRLDLAVRKIREGTTYADHLEDLKNLGFSFDSRRAGYGFNTLRDAVLKYRDINGDMNISRGFVIPKESPLWPSNMWGVHLGSCLRDIKRGKCYADRKEELKAIGYNFFINGRTSGKKYDFGRIKVAFQTYKQLFGDLLVQAKYVVPQDDDAWPKETWGIKLGTYTQLIRMGKYGEDKKSELIELGFLFDNQRAKYGFDLVKVALVRYKEIYGNFLVKQKFFIPSGDAAAAAQWPEKTWGIKLGNVLHDIRQGDSYRNKKDELEELGITFYIHKQPRGRQNQAQVQVQVQHQNQSQGTGQGQGQHEHQHQHVHAHQNTTSSPSTYVTDNDRTQTQSHDTRDILLPHTSQPQHLTNHHTTNAVSASAQQSFNCFMDEIVSLV